MYHTTPTVSKTPIISPLSGDLIPVTDNKYVVGTSSLSWKDGYFYNLYAKTLVSCGTDGYYYNGSPLWGKYDSTYKTVQLGNIGGIDLTTLGFSSTTLIAGYGNCNSIINISDSTVIGTNNLNVNNNNVSACTAIGVNNFNNTTHSTGIAIGINNLQNLGQNASGNIAIGYRNGNTISTGFNNTMIGYNADIGNGINNESLALGFKAIAPNTGDCQLGQSTVSGSAKCKYRTQTVSDEAWISGGVSTSSINNTGDITRTSNGTVTQTVNLNNSVTLNTQSGVITLYSVLSAGANTAFLLSNNLLTTSSTMNVTVEASTGGNSPVVCSISSLGTNAVTINVFNLDTTNPTITAPKIHFLIVKA